MSTKTKAACIEVLATCALILSSLFLLPSQCAYGQAPGSSRGLASGDGIHTIQGRVYFPSGQTASGRTVRVSLESPNNIGGFTTVVDPDGSFRFRSLQAGDYTVVVDAGKEFEIAREPANIYREASPGGRVVNVAIQLKYRIDSSNPAFAGVPQTALNLYQKGNAAAQKGNSKEAVDFLSKAVAAYPNFSLALGDLGDQYLTLFQWGKAAETFETLLKLKPNDAKVHLDMGIALYNVGLALLNDKKTDEFNQKMTEAGSHLRESIKLNSHGPSAHYYLGMALVRLRQYDEAQTELELAVKNGGENIALAHRFLGGLYQRVHKNKEAADEFEMYLKLDPKVKDADTIKGMIKTLRGQ